MLGQNQTGQLIYSIDTAVVNPAKPEQTILFTVAAWDTNCPQHIPQKFDAADVAAALELRDRKIAALEAEIAELKKATG